MQFSQKLASLLESSEHGRSFSDLRDIAGPNLGWEDYVKIISRERDLKRAGEQLPAVDPNDPNTWGFRPPVNFSSGVPQGIRDDRGRIIPWSQQEVIDAMGPIIGKNVRKYSSGNFQMPVFDDNDARQMGAIGVLQALDNDQGRLGTRFPSYAYPIVLKTISQGFAQGGWEFRKARGLLDDIKIVLGGGQNIQTVNNLRNLTNGVMVSPSLKTKPRPNLFAKTVDGGCTGHGQGEITPTQDGKCPSCGRPVSNEYASLAEPLQKFVQQVIHTVSTGTAAQFKELKQKLADMREEIVQNEQDVIPGAKTAGSTSGVRTSHMAKPVRATGLEVKSKDKGGGEVSLERPNIKRKDDIAHTTKVAMKDTIRTVVHKAGLNPQEQKIINRSFGLQDYPNKGSAGDPELNSEWVKKGGPEMTTAEIATELGISEVRVNQVRRKALEKLQHAAKGLKESSLSDEEFRLIHEVHMKFIRALLEAVASSEHPDIIYG